MHLPFFPVILGGSVGKNLCFWGFCLGFCKKKKQGKERQGSSLAPTSRRYSYFRLRCPLQDPEIASDFGDMTKQWYIDSRVWWKIGSDLRVGAAISKPQIHSFRGNSLVSHGFHHLLAFRDYCLSSTQPSCLWLSLLSSRCDPLCCKNMCCASRFWTCGREAGGSRPSGPVLRDTARLSQRYAPIARYGVFGVSTWPIGCDNPFHFPSVEHAKWRCDTPPQKGYLSDTCAIPYENKANGCDTPLCDTISKGIARYGGGISHWAAKAADPRICPKGRESKC